MKKLVLFLVLFFVFIPKISAGVLGDVDGDGKVGLGDVIYGLKVVSGVNVEGKPYKIASFNLDTFGLAKASNQPVLSVIAEIVERYHIVAIQEVRDESTFSLDILENFIDGRGNYNYEYVVCRPLGSTQYYKEQYAFFFRVQSDIGFVEKDVYIQDGSFERPPMAARFYLGTKEVVIINVHIDPDLVANEIHLIDDVARYFETFWGISNIFVVGDFNADCSYWDENLNYDLWGSHYNWIIGNELDTSLAGTDCTYDRIIEYIFNSFVVVSHGAFSFNEEMFLDYDFAKTVSDHYPVWIEVK